MTDYNKLVDYSELVDKVESCKVKGAISSLKPPIVLVSVVSARGLLSAIDKLTKGLKALRIATITLANNTNKQVRRQNVRFDPSDGRNQT